VGAMSPLRHDILLFAFFTVAQVAVWTFWYFVITRLGSF
jgi:hypothetical protein